MSETGPAGSTAPEPLRGFLDRLPADQIPLQQVLDTARAMVESYGFRPQDTPAIERLETLMKEQGGDIAGEMYRWTDGDDTEVGLRFDLTVPLSRVMAANARDLRFPYKRWQYGRVWRYGYVKAGRYREFGQFDADIVGSTRPEADAEICNLMHDLVAALGFDDLRVHISNRAVLDGLARRVGLDEERQVRGLFRELDKLDKQPWEEIRANLTGETDKKEEERSDVELRLTDEQVGLVREYLDISTDAGSNAATLDALAAWLPDDGPAAAGVETLRAILARIGDRPAERFLVDTTIARGLDYYTGPIFEVRLPDRPDMGSLAAGGRYDRLIGRFVEWDGFFREFPEYEKSWKNADGEPILPAVGASLGVDRLFAVMREAGLTDERETPTRAVIVPFSDDLADDYQKMAAELRDAGIPTEVYVGEKPGLRHVLKYADKIGIPVAVIMGPREAEDGQVSVRDLTADMDEDDKQVAVPRADLVATVRDLLGD